MRKLAGISSAFIYTALFLKLKAFQLNLMLRTVILKLFVVWIVKIY